MNEAMLKPFPVEAFNGGLTDNYLKASPAQFQRGDNFVITDDRKLLTRPGSQVADTTYYLPGFTLSNPRISALFEFQSLASGTLMIQLFEVSARVVYFNAGSGYATLTGPSGNPALTLGTTASRNAWATWNNHIILTNDAFTSPMKMFKDASGTWRIRNAGLPKLASNPVVTGSITTVLALANDLKAKYNAHLANTTQHAVADTVNPVSAANATNLATLITLINALTNAYMNHEADSEKASAWTYHRGTATLPRKPSYTTAPASLLDCVLRLNDLKAKFNSHDSDTVAHSTGNVNQETLADVVANSYIYAFCYYQTYTIGSFTFADYGATTLVQVIGIDSPDLSNVAITSIPTFANGSTENYDTSNVQVKIFRTGTNGQSLYLIGQVALGTTSFTDSTPDKNIVGVTELLYTDGGVYDNDPPPRAKFVVVANDICWYAHVQEGSQIVPNRIRQSKKFDIDSCPGSFLTDVEDDIMGMGAVGIYPIVFCKKRIYRLEGFVDDQGRGDVQKQEISRVIGCVSHNSIVQTRQGIFFAGNDGFYFTDGYSVRKVSREINATYKALVNKANIYGAYEEIGNRIWWAVQRDSSSGDNDACFIGNVEHWQSDDLPFTTMSGGLSFAPSALCYSAQTMYRSDKRGYLLKHDSTLYTDPKINTLAAPTTWGAQTIIYDYISAALDFGTTAVRKWVSKVVLYAKNISNLSLAIKSRNNDSSQEKDLKELRMRSNLTWGDTSPTWGDATLIWNYDKIISGERRFPAGGLRCDYKQVRLTNSYTIVENSDTLGLATLAYTGGVHTAVLSTYATLNFVWPQDCVDYFISFASDNYTRDFLITARTDSTITYYDPTNLTGLGASKWVIRGYRKGDVLLLENFVLWHSLMTDSQPKYQKTDSGANSS